MKEIIKKIDRDLIEKELSKVRFVRKTNAGNNEIYIFTAQDSPILMDEVGRLREETFRSAGGGTGLAADIDRFDTCEKPFHQLIVWNPEEREVVGGYRFIHGKDVKTDEKGYSNTPTGKLFRFSTQFVNDYLPYTVELGRSFVQPLFQVSKDQRKGLFALDNLWDGVGTLHVDYPDTHFFFGKITMYPHYNREARDILLKFMNLYFGDREKLVVPYKAVSVDWEAPFLKELFVGNDYDKDYKQLVKEVREREENIPPLVNAYMNLSLTMRVFGTSVNDSFGKVEETGILVTIRDIMEGKFKRYVTSYLEIRNERESS
ncbi:MAG: hemolysin [Bacteroidetes bacterium]|nr:MAG: hemolysin [Bacteroidota bacterium]PIE88165.1 MAG: hemolysin [Bacteroidota bacterium]